MVVNPLTSQHRDLLLRLEEMCAETRAYLERCERCHLDVSKELADNADQERVAQAIRREFFGQLT